MTRRTTSLTTAVLTDFETYLRKRSPKRPASARAIRSRREVWIRLRIFRRLEQIALEPYDHIVGLVRYQIATDGAITRAPGGGEITARSPVSCGRYGLKRFGADGWLQTPLSLGWPRPTLLDLAYRDLVETTSGTS